jgi:hypothetical protein
MYANDTFFHLFQADTRKNLTSILDVIKRRADVRKQPLPKTVKTEFKPYWNSKRQSAQQFKTKLDAYVAFTSLKF